MIVTTKQLFQPAYGRYAVGAYNINNLEQTVGLFRGNLGKSKSNDDPTNPAKSAPFILQISRGARGYSDKRFLEAMIRTADQVFPEVLFAVHLDHGTEDVCYDCIESGFYSSVMIDASHEEFAKNITTTRRIVDRAHAKGIVVEAELGQLGGVEEDIVATVCLTDPAQAAEFVEKSGCDSLAIAIGTSHGAYKFKKEPKLAFDVLEKIGKLLPGYPLVMHGSSSVLTEFKDLINKYGGKMPDAMGVPEEAISKASKMGVCKVNIDTDLRMALTAKIRQVFAEKPAEFDPRKYLGPGRDAIKAMVKHKLAVLGCVGKAAECM
jgi:fructose-bisphosphate aldolase, class II